MQSQNGVRMLLMWSAVMCELAAHTHAAMAELASLTAEFDELEGWCGDGLRSLPHWLTINAGFAEHTGSELLRVGQALRELPLLRGAFASGQLSFDSVRELTKVATPVDEQLWLDVAVSATGAQLARICRACRRALELDTREHADDQLSRRGLWSHIEDDGMIALRALLLPEEGALVRAALEAAMRANAAAADTEVPVAGQPMLPLAGSPDASAINDGGANNSSNGVPGADAAPDPAEPWAAQRADALVTLCEHALAANGGALVSDPATLPMLVHVDVGVLTCADTDGRRHLEGGPSLSLATIERLGCDASIIAITERDGIPIDVGRKQRIVPRGLRLAVQSRDRTCRFPGCAVPAQRTHAHHIEPWARLGETDRKNIVSLCHFHHRRHHEGVYAIRGNPDAELVFETPEGLPIVPPPRTVAFSSGGNGLRALLADADRLNVDASTPGTPDGTARMDLNYVVSVVLDGVERAHGIEPSVIGGGVC